MQSYYSTPTVLTSAKGNNALSYAERKDAGSQCSLFVPTLKNGSIDDLHAGTHTVFEEIDGGKVVSCVGLEHLIELSGDTKTYIMDNHNHALFFWFREYIVGRIYQGMTLIHIDQHADMGNPLEPFDQTKRKDISYIIRYANESCNVGSFIVPTQHSGLIGDVIQVRTTSKLEETARVIEKVYREKHDSMGTQYNNTANNNTYVSSIDEGILTAYELPYILDIDIDFWVDHDPTPAEITQIKTLYKHANLCTIALSPYFIDIHKAIRICQMLFR